MELHCCNMKYEAKSGKCQVWGKKEKRWSRKHDVSGVKCKVRGGKMLTDELRMRIVRPITTTQKKKIMKRGIAKKLIDKVKY